MPFIERLRAQSIGRWIPDLLLLAWIVVGGAYLGLRYYVWPRIDDWRPEIQAQVAAMVGRPVTIGRIETGFEGLLPRVTVEGLRIADDDGGVLLDVPRAVAVLSPRMLFEKEPRFAVLQLDRPRVRVERVAGGRVLRVAGIDVTLDRASDGRLLGLVLSQRRIVVNDATLDWVDSERGVRRVVDGVDLRIGSVGRRHRIALTAGPLGTAWRAAAAEAEFYRPARTVASDWHSWNGEAFVGADGFDWAGFAQVFPLPPGLPLEAGRADARAWMRFGQGVAQDALVKASASDVAFGEALRDAKLSKLEFEASALRQRDGYDVRVRRFDARDPAGVEIASAGEQRLTLGPDGRPTGGRVALRPFDLAPVLDVARRLRVGEPASAFLDSLRASGRIASFSATWQKLPSPSFEVNVDFSGLSMRRTAPADASLPWFENVDGEVRVTPSNGELRLRSQGATLAFPGIFADPAIKLDTLSGEARWRVDRSGERPVVTVDIGDARFANADAAGSLSGTYRTGGKGAGIVDLSATLERARAARAVRYLPLVVPADVRDWIAKAVTAGRLGDARMRLRGDLEDFPYRRDADGEFSVSARLDDATLEFAPGWPAIDHLQGRLQFERAGMLISMQSGKVFDVALGPTQASLPDFAKPLLRIDGSGEGPARDMVRFVNESPVATHIDDFTRDTAARGRARLKLRLDLPLDDLDRTRVAGAVQFLGDDVTIDRTIPALSAVTGTLEFNEQGLALRGIQARFLGGPLRVDGGTPEPGHFVIRASGTVDADGMRSVADNPLTRKLSGSASYRATVDVRRRASSVTIQSDLQGLGAALPPPFDKPAQAKWPLLVRTVAAPPPNPDARSPGDTITVQLRDDMRLRLERRRDPATNKLLIRRGAFALRGEPVLPDKGFAVQLNTDRIDIDQWTPLLSGGEAPAGVASEAAGFTEGFSLLPDLVSAVASQVRVGGKELHDVVVGATRERDVWRANIASREISGYFSWREALPGQRIGALTARFTRLEIPKAKSTEVESLLDTPPESLPALDLKADELILDGHPLGSLSLHATNGGTAALPTWTLDELRIENPSAKLAAHGLWEPHGAGSGTTLGFDLDLADSGGLLAIYGMKNVVHGGVGKLSGGLRWAGSPLAIDYPSLSGHLVLKVGKGQFLKTEPGIAKLIGVLNLQSLPRRLTLDFSDIFSKGFAFDDIHGDVTIEHGVAHTKDFVMKGVQAQVRISGSADIAAETQDLVAEVRPDLNAGLASLAYGAMANPVIGLGSFVAQLALRRPIEQLLGYEYEIKGSWADPQVSERRRVVRPAPETGPQ